MNGYVLPETLKALLKSRKISQEKFAEVVDRETKTVSNWIRGISYPNIQDLMCIAAYFGVSLDYLVYGEG